MTEKIAVVHIQTLERVSLNEKRALSIGESLDVLERDKWVLQKQFGLYI